MRKEALYLQIFFAILGETMTSDTSYEPIVDLEGIERLDLWDECHDAVQTILKSLDADVAELCPSVIASSGCNRGRSWGLFTYRTFKPPQDSDIDPVVVGIIFSESQGKIILSADISDETRGNTLFLLPERVTERPVVMEAAKELAQELAKQSLLVGKALVDLNRIA